ncbi:DNA phosphorothioation-associated putative methyltransferase [Pseudanabaena sp. UWO311]|uniref:DNA phosphorothioation-associated putative methyltransferase n=1 Tax=Pseudanabaena sp. UWO311 TaxID=2487337 RepID=UPI00115A56F1|nr:DNA phosphorothioation-associated putative methyltransferase [Pseudanabaena sp. UWO311]TYQ24155.1 DNA phosphorothioation-associated putative methyltransferase [Pseudanabaena sp. UWO311]
MITEYSHNQVIALCQQSKVGKKLPTALYVHISAIASLSPQLQECDRQARSLLPKESKFTIIKFNYEQPKISYLFYPDFDTDPHPALHHSIQVDLQTQTTQQRDYHQSPNPPILHRKETFVNQDYPLYQMFAQLTKQEEAISLFHETRTIGTRKVWEQRLQEYNIELKDHQVILPPSPSERGAGGEGNIKIDRHKAAIHRPDLSKPVRLALEAGLFTENTTFFDYGCGHGEDIKRISDRGFASNGWDPYYRTQSDRTSAEIVNLGYIINVIESQIERREALIKAWELTQKVLIVSAQVLIGDVGKGQIAYSDGVVSSRNTFQKYYEQEELKLYIDQVLGVDSVPVALGIYFVFRDEMQAQSFRASRFRSRATTPRIRLVSKRFEDYRELLTPLMDFFTERGRLPVGEELSNFEPLLTEFGTVRRAFNLIVSATNQDEWDAISDKRRQDILVFLALSNFDNPDKRLKLSQLSPLYQTDIKVLFGSYQGASTTSALMLFNLGKSGFIKTCCQNSKIGRLDSKALYVHVSALDNLDIMLRLYEGCVSRTIGRMDGATLVKFHLHKPKITYLFYPDFDTDPHPKLQTSIQIDLRDLQVRYHDRCSSTNPPILHRKEAYLMPSYPQYEKFTKLTQQEESWALLDNINETCHLQDWQQILDQNYVELQGHRLVWRKDADPNAIKLLKAKRKIKSHTNSS